MATDSNTWALLSGRTVTVPSIVSHYTDEVLNSEYHNKQDYIDAINKHGVIYKIVQFSECNDSAKLNEYAREWIRRNYYDGVLSFNVKAVDLHLLGLNKDKLLCGDKIAVEFKDPTTVTRRMTCLSAQYDLLKPENSTFKIGIPDVSTNIKYRDSINQKITQTGGKPPPSDLDILGTVIEGLQDLGDESLEGIDLDKLRPGY